MSSPVYISGVADQPSCTEVTETLSQLRICQWCHSIQVSPLIFTNKQDLLGRDKGAFIHRRRKANNVTKCPVANIYKETFLLLYGDRIGKSIVLLAQTHMHAHTGAHCAKLFEELVVLLLNEL